MAVVAIGLTYGLVYSGLRLALSDVLSQDDATANVLAQTLQLGKWFPKAAAEALARIDAKPTGMPEALRIPWTPLGAKAGRREWTWVVTFAAPGERAKR